MPVRTSTTYYIEHEGQEFETQFHPVEDSWQVTIKGDHALVSYLSSDDATGWYFDENDSGRFINRDPRCMGERLGDDELKELMEANPGRAFVIHKYEHGMCRYYRAGDEATAATIPDKQWDVSHAAAVFIVPEDAPDPEKYCDSVMEEFSNWCNGEIYGICHATYNKVSKDGEEWEWVEGETDECWGFIGSEYAEKELAEQHEEKLKE